MTRAAAGAGGHRHLWSSPDGTGLHAPYGQLVREDGTGRACCHLCGRWFRALGAHVRVHGHDAAGYRAAMGLGTVVLAAPDVVAPIAHRQAERYRTNARARAALATGQEMARTGELARLSVAADSTRRQAAQRASLERGRATLAARRAQDLEGRLAGTPLGAYLRRRYAEGASLALLGRETGLGRARLRQALDDAGVVLRPPGATTVTGRRSRAVAADIAAARRVGTDDHARWRAEQRASGRSVADLADAVGHSPPWVRWRLDRPAQ